MSCDRLDLYSDRGLNGGHQLGERQLLSIVQHDQALTLGAEHLPFKPIQAVLDWDKPAPGKGRIHFHALLGHVLRGTTPHVPP